MNFDYIRFFTEQLEARGLNKTQAAEFIKMRTGFVVTPQQIWEFLDAKRDSCPGTVMVKIWEFAFEVNLAPRYYGADSAVQKVEKVKRK